MYIFHKVEKKVYRGEGEGGGGKGPILAFYLKNYSLQPYSY